MHAGKINKYYSLKAKTMSNFIYNSKIGYLLMAKPCLFSLLGLSLLIIICHILSIHPVSRVVEKKLIYVQYFIFYYLH